MLFLLQTLSRDNGPIYTETNLDQLIVEPWNAASAIIFVFIALYWLVRLKNQIRQHIFLYVSSWILLIGGLGGFLYHAFRVSEVFLTMDWVPIAILSLAGSGFFFYQFTGKTWAGIIWLIGAFVALGINYWFAGDRDNPSSFSINLGYFLMALTVLLPTFMLLVKTKFSGGLWVLLALMSFGFALFFRIIDPESWLPMGTHFLWHVFGAIANLCMFMYVYEVVQQKEQAI